MGVPRTDSATWKLASHSDDRNMRSLVNVGTRPAIDVKVQLRQGPHQRPCGRVVFGRIDPGSAVNVYRFSPERDLPPWDGVTVTWRDGGRWFSRRRLRWDSDGHVPSASEQP